MIELEIAPVEGELATDSNRAVVNIEGVRDKLHVLLVSGKPHPGERMWRNLLKSDPNVDLVHFTILRPPEKGGDGTPINELSLIAFPVADLFGRKIKDFDLIIFDRYAQQSILPYAYLDNIANYVRNGGALLMAEGPEFSTPDGLFYSPLGAIAPAEPTGEDVEAPFQAKVSEEGLRHPVTRGLAGLDAKSGDGAWGRWFRLIGARPTGGADGDERPRRPAALDAVARRQGAGRASAQRSDVALGARLRRRRALSRSSAPPRPLADEGAGTRGRSASRQRQGPRRHGRAPERQRRGARNQSRRARRDEDEAHHDPDSRRASAARMSRSIATASIAPRTASMSRWSASAPTILSKCRTSSRRRKSCAPSPRRPAARCAGWTRGGGAVAMPRVVSLNPAASYGGSDYIGIKRTGSSELIGVRSTSLASGFFGLALLLGAVLAAWLAEAGRFRRGGR